MTIMIMIQSQLMLILNDDTGIDDDGNGDIHDIQEDVFDQFQTF